MPITLWNRSQDSAIGKTRPIAAGTEVYLTRYPGQSDLVYCYAWLDEDLSEQTCEPLPFGYKARLKGTAMGVTFGCGALRDGGPKVLYQLWCKKSELDGIQAYSD